MPVDELRKPGRRVPIRVLEWFLDRAVMRGELDAIERRARELDLAYADHLRYLDSFRDPEVLEAEINRFVHRRHWAQQRISRYERPAFEEVSG